jgi:aarF domain-containing kinase
MDNTSMPKRIPQSFFSRTRELLGTAARIGSQEIAYQLRKGPRLESRLEQARTLVETLSRLKGAAMKVGQWLSIDAADYLPAEVRAVFSQLQNQSPHFLPLDEIQKILAWELDASLLKEIHFLGDKPIAAASIGQLHRVRFRGRNLALKVQYPGVAESIDTDLDLLRKVVGAYLLVSQKKLEIDALFLELGDTLKRETDYLQELDWLRRFKDIFEGDKTFRIPEVETELCTKRVLAMSFEQGVTLSEWIRTSQDEAAQRFFGEKALELYCREFFDFHVVQTDPNFSNFLVSESERRLTLLDFGAVKSYPRSFVQDYAKLLGFIHEQRESAAIEKGLEMGFIDAREKPETQKAFYEMLRASTSAFDEDKQPFNFASEDYYQWVKQSTLDFTQKVEFSPPPQQLIFLHRKLSGVYNLLKQLDLQVDLRPYWKKWVEPLILS